MVESAKSFPTKTGRCYVYADRLVLTREGAAGAAAQTLVGSSMVRPLLLYGGLAAFLLYSATRSFQAQDYGFAAFFALLGLGLLANTALSLKNSATSVIERAAIQRVEFRRARPGLTRACFVVFFLKNGQPRRRLILLPGSLSNGAAATAQAVAVLQSEQLLAS